MNTKFFGQEETKRVIKSYRSFLDKVEFSNEFEQARNKYLQYLLKSFDEESEVWDLYCQINIKWIGDYLLKILNSQESAPDRVDDVYSTSFRFLLEREISSKPELSLYFREIKSFTLKRIDNFSISAKEYIEYATRDMPTAILKEIVNDNNMASVKEFIELSKKSEGLIQQWNADIKEKEDRVNHLKLALDKHENAFNFVGLYSGFDNLSTAKKTEMKSAFKLLKILAFSATIPILIEIFFVLTGTKLDSTFQVITAMVPMISLFLVFIYYFRVALNNYQSIKSQINQIELRKTLCMFIQSYAEYSIEIKSKDKEVLSKFENIIFSNIMTIDEKLPSTFDGIEQISNLVKSMKN
ncbi:hypothetical protein OU748_004171 [Yersinia enterocolitica]|uniref:hypothetical protein n=1 Tax=Yersinia enterocolitica TaxID=630 RepID=UPI0028B744DA|nr:hypothetical protein [Yersinia enterocolitica]EKN3753317.1 hypothetical protein [Yersinia enterocolitica]EKN3797789.1 hypothetical protein [Yersinia enterocolitica]EKN3878617.1 hypothetical protein [Yersinia enterocolitica]EKN4176529.1 hypothetical protein [Yersinia enterocolitica]